MSLDDLKFKIKEEIPISSIIGNYLSIKRQGSSQVSVCPFHDDKKPSMNINDSRKIFKCFACGAAGDAIGFVMKYRNIDFIDALKEICSKQGIHFESYQEEKRHNPKLEMAKKILSKTALLYRKIATSGTHTPYKEFISKRGLNEELATTYSLGFAPNKNSVSDYLNSIPDTKEKEFALTVALDLGIIRRDMKNPEAQYDTFRERVIFPIWDQFGQVVGFTSRAIRDDQKAKYMNSVESFIYNKSQTLYGFHLAKNAIREKDAVILVEGNMDQIALYNQGFQNTVAIMGTAISHWQIERMVSLTKNIYLALDNDTAGQKAMERANHMLAQHGVVAKYIDLSPQKDPDDYLKANGAMSFLAKIEEARAAFDVVLDKMIPEKLPEVLDRKLEILHKIFELISPLEDELAATERIVHTAKRLGLKNDSTQIVKSYTDYLLKNKEKNKKTTLRSTINTSIHENIDDEVSLETLNEQSAEQEFKSPPQISLTKMERLLLQEVVQLPALTNMDNMNEILDLVSHDEVKKYIGKIRKIIMEVDDSEYESVVLNFTNSPDYSIDLREAVTSAFYQYKYKEVDNKTKKKILFDLKIKLKTEKLKLKKEEIKSLQKGCETEDQMITLLNQLTEIEKEMQSLKNLKPDKN